MAPVHNNKFIIQKRISSLGEHGLWQSQGKHKKLKTWHPHCMGSKLHYHGGGELGLKQNPHELPDMMSQTQTTIIFDSNPFM